MKEKGDPPPEGCVEIRGKQHVRTLLRPRTAALRCWTTRPQMVYRLFVQLEEFRLFGGAVRAVRNQSGESKNFVPPLPEMKHERKRRLIVILK